MHRWLKFPYHVTTGSTRLKYDILCPSSLTKAREWYEMYSRVPGSVGTDEGVIDDILANPVDEDRNAFQATDSDSGKLLGVSLLYPGALCRSNRPMASAAYMLMDPDAKGRKVGFQMFEIVMWMSLERGYLCHVPRGVIGGPSMHLTMSQQHIITGVVPYSLFKPDRRRLPDLITYFNHDRLDPDAYNKRFEAITYERNVPISEPMGASPPQWAISDEPLPMETKQVTTDRISYEISMAEMNDIAATEHLIRDAASKGIGWGQDEFIDGYFNRRMLRQCHTLVAKTQEGRLIGGIIFGPTTICRSKSAPILSAYIVVDPDYYRLGVGKSLLTQVEDYARETGMLGLFVDIYATDHTSILFLRQRGYVCVSSFPKAGFLDRHGITDAALWYKQLNESEGHIS